VYKMIMKFSLMEGFINCPLLLLVIMGRRYDKEKANAQFWRKTFSTMREEFEI